MDCIFCKIIGGEIPASKIYEDDDFVAFLDIMPANKGHTLVVPKEHYETFLDMPEETAAKLAAVVKKVGDKVIAATNPDGYNIFTNNKKAAGQEVPHLHVHIVPRFGDDGMEIKWSHLKYEEGEMEELAEKIKSQ